MAIDLSGLPDRKKKANISVNTAKTTSKKSVSTDTDPMKGLEINAPDILNNVIRIVGESAKDTLKAPFKGAEIPFSGKEKDGDIKGKSFGDVLREFTNTPKPELEETETEGGLPFNPGVGIGIDVLKGLQETIPQIPGAIKEGMEADPKRFIKDTIAGTAADIVDEATAPANALIPDVLQSIGKSIQGTPLDRILNDKISDIPAAMKQMKATVGGKQAESPAEAITPSIYKGESEAKQPAGLLPAPEPKVTPEGVDLSGLPEPTIKPTQLPESSVSGPKGVTVEESTPILPTRSVKPVINESTGVSSQKYGTGELVPESKALEQSMKRQESASKTGFRAGKKEQKEINQLYKGINKPVSENLPFESKRQIEALQETLKNTKTLKDLRELYDKIKMVKEMGKARYTAIKEAKAMQDKLELNLALKTLDASSKVKPKVKANEKPMFKKVGEGWNAYTRRPMRIIDELDGGANFQGPHHNILIDRVNDGLNKELIAADRWIDEGLKLQKETGIAAQQLSEERVINGTKYRLDEMLHIYAVRGNKENLKAIVFGNKIPVKDVIAIVNNLSDTEKFAADNLTKMIGKRYPALREAFIEYYNGTKDLGFVENGYVPMVRRGIRFNSQDEEFLDDYTQRVLYKNKYADKSMTKERTELSAENQNEIRLGLFENYYDHVQKREHFINLGNIVKDMQRFVNNKEWSEAVQSKFGDEYLKTIRRYADKVGNPRIYQSMSLMAKAVWALRKNAAIGYMGLNVLSAIKQPASWFLFMNEVGPLEMTAATSKLMMDFDNQIRFINKAAPQMKHRSLERELDELRRVSVKKFEEIQNKLGNASMQMLIRADKFTASAGWLAVYDKMTRLGFAEDDAIREATNAVLRTQGSALTKDLPEALTDERLLILNQFQNFANNLYNIMTYDIPMRASTGRSEQAMLGALGVTMAIATEWMISNGKVPDSPKDFANMMLQPLDSIPVFGSILNGARKGFEFKIPALEAVSKTGKAIGNAMQGNLDTAAKEGVQAIGLAAGIPVTQPTRTITGAMDLASGEDNDARRVLYSKYTVDEAKEESDIKKLKRANRARKEGKDFKAFLIEKGLA